MSKALGERFLASAVIAAIVLVVPTSRSIAQTSDSSATGPNAAQTRDNLTSQIGRLQADKALRTAAERKIDSALLFVLKKQRNPTAPAVAGVPNLQTGGAATDINSVEIETNDPVTPELLNNMKKLGAQQIIVSTEAGTRNIHAQIPTDKIIPLAEMKDVKFIARTPQASTNVAIASEGDIAHAAKDARQTGLTGAGVKVGIISDSIDNRMGALNDAVANGFVSGDKLSILEGQQGTVRVTGEGLAMAEIVHTIAPDAEIYFATGTDNGPIGMANNIRALADKGCNVIVDDIVYYDEPPFQDGEIARAVSDVSGRGVLYFSAARNSGNKYSSDRLRNSGQPSMETAGTWEGDFDDGGLADPRYGNGHVHVWTRDHLSPAGTPITWNTIDTADAKQGTLRADLFWADPLQGSANDYELFVVDTGGNVVGSGNTTHDGSQGPHQYVETIAAGQSIVVVKATTAAPRFLHLDVGVAHIRYYTAGSVRGHSASGAANAYSVAAVRAPSPPVPFKGGTSTHVEPFSSDGPRRVFFDATGEPITPGNYSSSGGLVLKKPDLAAADGVTTSLIRGTALNPFKGTSAAAPHAAAIAALLLSCNPRPTPESIKRALLSSTIAIDDITDAGAGIIMANTAASLSCHPNPSQPVVSSSGG